MTATATPANAAADRRGARPRSSRSCGRACSARTSATTSRRRRTARSGCGRSRQAARGVDDGAAIVYARSRRSCEEIARTLAGHGIRAEHYHAGLEADERTRVQEAFVSGQHARGRRDDRVRHGHRQARRPSRRARQPSRTRSRATCRWSAARAATEPRATPCSSPAPPTRRRCGGSRSAACRRPSCSGMSTASSATPVASPSRSAFAELAGDHDPRVLVGMLEQAGSSAATTTSAGRCGSSSCRSTTATGRALDDAARPLRARGRRTRRADHRVRRDPRLPPSPGRRALRRVARRRRADAATSARHGGRQAPVAAADAVRSPRRSRRARSSTPSSALAWPLGRRSLVAMLRGSVKAPPSARRSPAFGSLAAASESEVTRWIRALEAAGALVEVEADGFRVLRADPAAPVPVARLVRRRPRIGGAARRRAARLAAAARTRGRRPGVRRAPRRDDRRARARRAPLAGRALRRQGPRADEGRAVRRRAPRGARNRLRRLKRRRQGYNSARFAASTTHGGSAPARPHPEDAAPCASARPVRARGRGVQLRARDGDPQRARRARPVEPARRRRHGHLLDAEQVRPTARAVDPPRGREPRARPARIRSRRS